MSGPMMTTATTSKNKAKYSLQYFINTKG